jgi:TrpR-related protein YerC/YecD
LQTKEIEKLNSPDFQSLYKAFLKCRNEEEIMKFMRDLMTMKELEAFALRWKAAQMLTDGVAYLDIERQTGLSSATIARVSEYLKYGYDGYKIVLERTK